MKDINRRDGNLIAQENRDAVLRWVHRFGGLTSRQIARLVWSETPSGIQMAQRTIRNLQSHRLVLARRLPNGGVIYVIGDRGAWELRDLIGKKASMRGHRDLKFDKPLHRLLANEFVIDQHLAGRRIWTEFEVQRRRAPVPQISATTEFRIPDAVFELPKGLVWVEVENSYKGPERIRPFMKVAKRLFAATPVTIDNNPSDQRRYAEMLFISPDILRLTAVLRQINDAWDREEIDQDIAARLWLAEVSMSSGFVWGGVRGTVSACDFFLGAVGIEPERRRQAAVRELLARHEGEFRDIDDRLLWPLFIDVLISLDIEIEALNPAFTLQAGDYDELLEHPPLEGQLPRAEVTEYLFRLDSAARHTDIGFNRDTFKAVCDGVPLIPRPTFALAIPGMSPPQNDDRPQRSLYPRE